MYVVGWIIILNGIVIFLATNINNSMSLQITLPEPKIIVKQPEITETISVISIDRIVDIPGERKVFVFVKGERIELEQLSGDNYDTPNEWTNEDVVSAVKAYYGLV